MFREVRQVALERYCEQVLGEVGEVVSDSSQSNHERYLAVYKLIERRDETLAGMFDAFRRSTALRQLRMIVAAGLLTEEEISRFSEETREIIRHDGTFA